MYKQYAEISSDNVLLEYPVNPRSWDISKGDYNVPIFWEGGELNGKTYVLCHNFEPPYQFDEALVEKAPARNPENGLWYRQYDVVKVSPEVLEERTVAATEAAQREKALLLKQFAEFESLIPVLPEDQQKRWLEYYESILNIEASPGYPFTLTVLPRPDTANEIKLEVTRI